MNFVKTSILQPLQYFSGGQFHSKRPWVHAKRSIDSFEIIIGINETLYIEQDGQQYEVKPGDVLILLPHHLHQGYSLCEKNISFYWFHFLCPSLYEIIEESSLIPEISHLKKTKPRAPSNETLSSAYLPIFSHPPGINRLNIFSQQLLHVANSIYYTKPYINYLLTSLLIELSEQTVGQFLSAEKTVVDKNLAKIKEWMRIHSFDELSVTQIAELFNYNKDYLSRLFKQKTGVNLIEYIHLLKLAKAKDLLSRTTQSIKEISYSVGIADDKYFIRLFKRYEKVTPTEFRKAFFRTNINNGTGQNIRIEVLKNL